MGPKETLTRPDTSRHLVTLETVTALRPIENADFIAAAKVRGWNLIVKKDEVSVGDRGDVEIVHVHQSETLAVARHGGGSG